MSLLEQDYINGLISDEEYQCLKADSQPIQEEDSEPSSNSFLGFWNDFSSLPQAS